MQWAKYKQGFTIVELLIVVVVIAILAAITIVSYNGVQNRAKTSAAQSAASQAGKKLSTVAVTNADTYPTEANFTAATGLKNSGDATYQYTPTTDLKGYCLTTTKNNLSYYTTHQNPTPLAGACSGHGVNGVAPIVNLIPNPSFEVSTSGWSVSSNITTNYSTTGGLYGSRYHSGSRTGTAAIGFYSGQFNVTGGETYTASMAARYTAGRQIALRIVWTDDVGANPSTTASAVTGTGSWQTVSYTVTAPANAVTGRFDIILNTTSAAVGDTLSIDGVMVTKGTQVYTYADGDSAGWVWTGTPGLSTSNGPPL